MNGNFRPGSRREPNPSRRTKGYRPRRKFINRRRVAVHWVLHCLAVLDSAAPVSRVACPPRTRVRTLVLRNSLHTGIDGPLGSTWQLGCSALMGAHDRFRPSQFLIRCRAETWIHDDPKEASALRGVEIGNQLCWYLCIRYAPPLDVPVTQRKRRRIILFHSSALDVFSAGSEATGSRSKQWSGDRVPSRTLQDRDLHRKVYPS